MAETTYFLLEKNAKQLKVFLNRNCISKQIILTVVKYEVISGKELHRTLSNNFLEPNWRFKFSWVWNQKWHVDKTGLEVYVVNYYGWQLPSSSHQTMFNNTWLEILHRVCYTLSLFQETAYKDSYNNHKFKVHRIL